MKVRIGDYIVELQARRATSESFTDEDMKELLDKLSFYFDMAADHLSNRKRYALADEALQMSNDIYRQLKYYGYYDRV